MEKFQKTVDKDIALLYYRQQREVPVLHVLIHESLDFPFFMQRFKRRSRKQMRTQRTQFMNTNRLPKQPLFVCAKFAGLYLDVILDLGIYHAPSKDEQIWSEYENMGGQT